MGMREERKSGCERRDRVGGGRERVVEKEVREGEREEGVGKESGEERKRGEGERVCVRKREGNERGEEGRVWE